MIWNWNNSASESPDWTLGYMFVCQPDLVAKSFMALPPATQQALFPILSLVLRTQFMKDRRTTIVFWNFAGSFKHLIRSGSNDA
jgi:hypothetical protein